MITGLTIAGINAHQSWPFYVAVGATATHLLHQVTIYEFFLYILLILYDCFNQFKQIELNKYE